MNSNRRLFLKTVGTGAAAWALAPLSVLADEEKKTAFELPKLPYDYDALEPHIDAETMKIHHDFHHKAYVDNLNKALKDLPDWQNMAIEAILQKIDQVPEQARSAVRNNGGGHANHSMFWQIMAKDAGGKPKGNLGKAIDEAFGGFEKFQEKLSDAAIKRFGSGWAWLILDKGKLAVISTANQDSPLSKDQAPILGLDVWEHAYYLKYRNKRADYIKAWWNVVNWDNVADRYAKASKEE